MANGNGMRLYLIDVGELLIASECSAKVIDRLESSAAVVGHRGEGGSHAEEKTL